MDVVRVPDRPPSLYRTHSVTRSGVPMPPRPDSPRLYGDNRSARLAQTRQVWGMAAASARGEDRYCDFLPNVSPRMGERRGSEVYRGFGSFHNTRSSMISSSISQSTYAGNRASSSNYRSAVFRRAASSHKYARTTGSGTRGASGNAKIAPRIALREQLAAIDEGLGAVTVIEKPVVGAAAESNINRRNSKPSLRSFNSTPAS